MQKKKQKAVHSLIVQLKNTLVEFQILNESKDVKLFHFS